MKVALVYDRVNKWGGAERVLLALHEIWPEAPLYTAVYDHSSASWADVFTVKPSLLQHIPFARRHHEWFAWATPLAFETFDLDAYDLVISITSAEAKYVITKPHTLHICYCLTPTRYLWSGEATYRSTPGLGAGEPFVRLAFHAVIGVLKQWDMIGSSRPDRYIAISERVRDRIEEYYGRRTDAVIYPPVDIGLFHGKTANGKRKTDAGDYFLVVSRLVQYKRIDLIVDAFNQLKMPLIIVGSGLEEYLLAARASDTISFVSSYLTDEQLASYYGSCRAFISAADEDFGIAAVEAQAAGKPVIAYARSGTAEIVRSGKTGIVFPQQSVESIMEAVRNLSHLTIREQDCVANAERFAKERFIKEMKETVYHLYNRYTKYKNS
ncbi:glycosyltransferase [Candidatus Gottesmanbacteria bacterium]|nr:glycosyltransferase [Candidatus Gottesmanbacteria bacterium]